MAFFQYDRLHEGQMPGVMRHIVCGYFCLCTRPNSAYICLRNAGMLLLIVYVRDNREILYINCFFPQWHSCWVQKLQRHRVHRAIKRVKVGSARVARYCPQLSSCLPLPCCLFCLLVLLLVCCHGLTVSGESAWKMTYILDCRTPGEEEQGFKKIRLLNWNLYTLYDFR